MKYDPNIHHRRSIRLKGKDYSGFGAYFVTIVSYQREEIFGEIQNGEMVCSQYGNIVREEWFKTAQLRPNVQMYEDEFVVMPNHIHGIIWIIDDDIDSHNVGAQRRCAPTWDENPAMRNVVPGSLGAIMRGFKSAATYRINALRAMRGAPVWQRNYYEHIVRNEASYKNILNYIGINPQRWRDDQLHSFAPPNRFNHE
jgi:putative transposase